MGMTTQTKNHEPKSLPILREEVLPSFAARTWRKTCPRTLEPSLSQTIMKKLLLILSLFAACFAGAKEHQRNAFGPIPLLITAAELQVTNPIVGSTTLDTNAPTVQSDLNDIIAHLVSTNWYFAAYY